MRGNGLILPDFEALNPISSLISELNLLNLMNDEESSFFAQGGLEIKEPLKKNGVGTIDANDRVLAFRILNNHPPPLSILTAIIFGYSKQPQTPLVSVDLYQYNKPGSLGQEAIRNDLTSDNFMVQGLKMVFINNGAAPSDFQNQILQPIKMVERDINGATESYIFQTTYGQSPTNSNRTIMDFPGFNLILDGDMELQYNIANGVIVYMFFTIKRRLNYENAMFEKNILETCDAPRLTGNPMYDMVMENQENERLKNKNESDYGLVEKSFYPRPTGNPMYDSEIFKLPT